MKITFKGIAANVVTVKFTLACKCHVLADFQKKMPIFGKNSDLPKIPYMFWQGVFCFKFLTFITFHCNINKKRYDTSVSINSLNFLSQSITYKTNRAPSVWKNMPQIQPMYFHRHRDTLIQQTSEARRRHVTNAFYTYVVCQKSSCTPFIFSTEK